jgi:hypothetical protein
MAVTDQQISHGSLTVFRWLQTSSNRVGDGGQRALSNAASHFLGSCPQLDKKPNDGCRVNGRRTGHATTTAKVLDGIVVASFHG